MQSGIVLPIRDNAILDATRPLRPLTMRRKTVHLVPSMKHPSPMAFSTTKSTVMLELHQDETSEPSVWIRPIVLDIVDDAMRHIPTDFDNDTQHHLNTFLRAIRNHVVPDSPSTNGSTGWSDDDPTIIHGDNDMPTQLGRVLDPIIRPQPVMLTVDAFRAAFETGDFSRVDAFMAAYEVTTPKDTRFQFLHDSRLANRNRTLQVVKQAEDQNRSQMLMAPVHDQHFELPEESDGIAALLREMNTDLNIMNRSGSSAPMMPMYSPNPLLSLAVPACQYDDEDGLEGVDSLQSRRSSCMSDGHHITRERTRAAKGSVSAKANLIREFRVIKHGRRGAPKAKNLVVDTDMGVITWGSGSVLIRDIKQIRCGRQTRVLNKKSLRQANEGVFASIVTEKRTVDLELMSRNERNFLVSQVQELVSVYLRRESKRNLSWRRQSGLIIEHEYSAMSLTTSKAVSVRRHIGGIVAKVKQMTRCGFTREDSLSLTITHHF